MAKRNKLKSVAYGVCDHFLSLYNRINGYWALGVIYKQALNLNTKSISLELLNKTTEPTGIQLIETLDYFNNFLYRLLDNHGLEKHIIKKAYINIIFDIEPTSLDLKLIKVFGKPLYCQVVLIDKKNNEYIYQQRDRCMEYDKGNFVQNFYENAIE